MSSLDLIATSTFGLEGIVARELSALGYEAKPGETGRVHFTGDRAAICRANLWLRAADRVVIRLGEFEAKDFGELFDRTKELPWAEWIAADGAFVVKGRSLKSMLSSVPACQRICKKAIVESLRAAHGVEELPETGAEHVVEVSMLKDRAILTLDTSGAGLHKRGYRTLVGPAQLRETLAASLVMLSFWRPDRPLIDPFCGTGTIPIEAALIGRTLAPGLNREFAAERWGSIPATIWAEARREARDLAQAGRPLDILGADVDAASLELARRHAKAAGVDDTIEFRRQPFTELASDRKYGCVIANPPYGERIGIQDEIEELYRTFPEVLRRLPTWSHYVITSNSRFERLIGREADRRRKLYNARIECNYYQFHGPRPPRSEGGDGWRETALREREPNEGAPIDDAPIDDAPIDDAPRETAPAEPAAPATMPVFGGISEKTREQAAAFRNRLVKRAKHLRRWPSRGTPCYRLYDRDIPEVPLVVDRYGDAIHLSEYERPHERAPGEHADWLDLMLETAADALGVDRNDAFLKRRQRQRGATQHEAVAAAARTYEVEEGGLRFCVNLSDYVDTGLFLDHRDTRAMVRKRAEGKRVLNLFGYTGSFTVYAAAGGARETVTVDLSRTYLDWAAQNLELNHLTGPQHRLVQADVREYLESLPHDEQFDLIVLDPPTFSNSKMTDRLFEVRRDHPELINLALDHLAEGGELLFSTNFKNFRLYEDQIRPGFELREITDKTVPEDFRRRVHRCWWITPRREEPPPRPPAGPGT